MGILEEHKLWRYRHGGYLWVSPEEKKIYLSEHKACLILYFEKYKEMLSYIEKMADKGFVI